MTDAALRKHAEEALEQASQQDMGQLMHALVSELVSEQQQEVIRQQAGMYVKLMLSAVDEAIKECKLRQWSELNSQLKAQIKGAVLQTLHSATSRIAQHTAALIIGKMGAIELPKVCMYFPPSRSSLSEHLTSFSTSSLPLGIDTIWLPAECMARDAANIAQQCHRDVS